jgi:aminoglycoside 3-N-acetyltransferase
VESIEQGEISRAFRALGLARGDVVNVHSRLHAIGSVRGAPTDRIPDVYLEALREVVGDDGTIVVPTYTTAVGRYGERFVLEETPSEMGVLSEHVRTRPGARRTLHPIVSLTALGARAAELADDHPRWNVGHDTIWDRMLRARGKVVTIGIEPKRSMSFMHQVEFLACVPYLYHKVLRCDVYAGGVRIDADFLMAVRYLGYGIEYDLDRLDAALQAAGAIRHCALGGNAVWSVPMESAFEVAMRGLRADPFYLLARPPAFVAGEIPLDGTTAGREATVPRYFLT